MKRKRRRRSSVKQTQARKMEHSFYMSVYNYILSEYDPEIGVMFTDSPIAGSIVDLVGKYYWGGNNVPNTTADIADLLRSKYLSKGD